MSGAACVVLVPMLRRPHRVAPLIESFDNTAADARLLFICSPDDEPTIAAVKEADADVLVVDWEGGVKGDYAKKINAGYRATEEPWLLTAADDLGFHPGWLGAALIVADWHDAAVVGTNDLGNARVLAGEHSTHTLVRRSYVDRIGATWDDGPGVVLHEGYWHEYVDDELVAVAKKRGVWAFARSSHVEHLHPHWGKAPTDEMYDAQAHRMRSGARLFQRRRMLWT